MKTTLVIALAVICLSFSTSAASQTCANPLPALGPNPFGNVHSGDLCAATNSLPSYGAVPSPQNEIIYSFVAPGANGLVSIAANTFGGFVALMPSPCATPTDIIAAGNSTTPMPVMGLVNGATYYLIVTADPGGPSNACGPYTIGLTGFPVTLQSFSVE